MSAIVAALKDHREPALTVVARARSVACRAGATSTDVWACRKAVAKQLALDACGKLQTNPPNPPFLAASLQLDSSQVARERHPDDLALTVYVEQSDDIVSSSIQTTGAPPTLGDAVGLPRDQVDPGCRGR